MVTESDELPSSRASVGNREQQSDFHSPALDSTGHDALLGQLVADRYRILELLGSGGMGAVYRAEHVHMRKPVAIKVLHRELTHLPDVVTRFEREAIAAARIAHPNVASATDFGRLADGACYLVLEYVQGKSLRQSINQSAPFSVEQALGIARQIAQALGAAHEAGIVHRDLKPENVMLVQAPSEPDLVKVLDFGIAKIRMPEQEAEPALTRLGTIFGTPEYMSPEQALGQNADARTDLYSLGIIMYEMLTGRTPFADKELVAVLTRQMTDMPPPLPSDIDPLVSALIGSLLAKRPSERPQTAHEVVTRIEALLSLGTGLTGEATAAERAMGERLSHGNELTVKAVDFGNLPRAEDTPNVSKQSLPPWLRKNLWIGHRSVPLVLVLLASLGATVVVLLFVSFISLFRSSAPSAHAVVPSGTSSAHRALAPASRMAPPDPLLKRARLGDLVALHELEKRPLPTLDAEHCSAIARGRARNHNWAGMLEAYAWALDKEPSMLDDGDIASDVHNAALDATASASALRFAVERLRSKGVDIVYDAWAAAASGHSTQVDTKFAKKLLEDSALRRVASKALLVTLELMDARGCGDYRRALPKVISDGDERCLRTLRRLTYDRGCGLFGLGDCYSCLRGSAALSQAIESVRSRPSPVF
jgi:eukaryotic-like serine/threonine-protein kinase